MNKELIEKVKALGNLLDEVQTELNELCDDNNELYGIYTNVFDDFYDSFKASLDEHIPYIVEILKNEE